MTIDGEKLFRDNVLAGLRDTLTEFGDLERKQVSIVAAAREIGVTWAQIGEVLGVSRQAAWERFADRIGVVRAGSASD